MRAVVGGIVGRIAALVATSLFAVSVAAPVSAAPPVDRSERCSWPMWGRDRARTFATSCPGIDPANAADLRRIWFFNTHDVVTATPAVVDGTVYVGDWSGRFYALRATDGKQRWVRRTKRHENVYAGQIVSSAAVATARGVQTVYFGGGKTLYALRASDGSVRWKVELNPEGGADDPTEIESSPVVADGLVVFGWDVHNSTAGEPAGVLALDAGTGRERWRTVLAPTEGDGATGPGCADVWSSPTIDEARRLVFVGTGNCVTSPRGYGRFAEAVVALDLDDGSVRWSYQPHAPNRDDLDFAGAPNLFESSGRALVGLGGKDGTYYVARPRDRRAGVGCAGRRGGSHRTRGATSPPAASSGRPRSRTASSRAAPRSVTRPTCTRSTPTRAPCSGSSRSRRRRTRAPAVGGGVVVIGGTDFTMRAVDLATGNVLWSDEVSGAVSGGPAIVSDDVFAVAGIREPGLRQRSRTSGVYRYSLRGKPVTSTTTRARPGGDGRPPATTLPATPQPCVGSPCDVRFDLVPPPAGTSPRMQLARAARSMARRHQDRRARRSGCVAAARQRLGAGGRDARMESSSRSVTTTRKAGSSACSTPKGRARRRGSRAGATYNRITILAITDSDALPSPAEGVDRLVVTKSFDPPLLPARPAKETT